MEALRFRLEDKEHQLNKQEVVMTTINTDKSKQSSEADELREMNELKERKIVALQRKVRVFNNLNLISEIMTFIFR